MRRVRNPNKQQYSCFSSSYSTLSRIDLALGNGEASQIIKDIAYQPRGVSDHSLMMVSVNLEGKKTLGVWKINPFWFEVLGNTDEVICKVREL